MRQLDLLTQYDHYLLVIDNKRKELLSKKVELESVIKELRKDLKELYTRFTTINIEFKDITNEEKLKIMTIRSQDNKALFELFKDQCNNYNSLLVEYNEVINKYNTLPPNMSYGLYYKIISRFFRNLQEELLDGYVFNPGHNIGIIAIAKKANYFKDNSEDKVKHNNRRINWGRSKKLKNKLLSEGKELYDNNTGKGEKYLIYIDTDFSLWLYWKKVRCTLKNKIYYSLKPILGNTWITLEQNATLSEIKQSNCGMIKKIKHIEQYLPELHKNFIEI